MMAVNDPTRDPRRDFGALLDPHGGPDGPDPEAAGDMSDDSDFSDLFVPGKYKKPPWTDRPHF